MRNIKSQTQTLEARIAAAELRTSGQGVSDEVLQAYMRYASIICCFVRDWRDPQSEDPQPEEILRRLLESGIAEDEARRYACMTYDEMRDEFTNDPALDIGLT